MYRATLSLFLFGIVFAAIHEASAQSAPTTICDFDFSNRGPRNAQIENGGGTIYGTTGGGSKGYGTVYQATRQPNGQWTCSVFYRFYGANGSYPNTLALDQKGNLFGTTIVGGSAGYGTVFLLNQNGVGLNLYNFQAEPVAVSI